MSVTQRRERTDRREHGDSGRRGMRRRSPRMERVNAIISYTLGILACIGVILFTVSKMKPVALRQASLTERMSRRVDSLKVARGGAPAAPAAAAPDSSAAVAATGTGQLRFRDPKVESDRVKFSKDLVATGRMEQGRADSVAFFAVREAYSRNLPPALIFGVMLTENSTFISKARSNVGAAGLMQIYGKVWLSALGKKFGRDLENDETNFKYGAFILSEYLKPKGKKGAAAPPATVADLRRGLLKYNGCVRGTNTPRCHTYPSKVDKYLQKDAKNMCGGKGFYECVARPFVQGVFGDTAVLASNAPASTD
jgi:hypothetical protein